MWSQAFSPVDQLAIQILPHKSRRSFGRRACENLNRCSLKQRVRARAHAAGDYEVDTSFLQPWRQEPWLVFRSGHFGGSCRLLRNRIDVHEGKLLAVAEVLGKASVGNGNGNSHLTVVPFDRRSSSYGERGTLDGAQGPPADRTQRGTLHSQGLFIQVPLCDINRCN